MNETYRRFNMYTHIIHSLIAQIHHYILSSEKCLPLVSTLRNPFIQFSAFRAYAHTNEESILIGSPFMCMSVRMEEEREHNRTNEQPSASIFAFLTC